MDAAVKVLSTLPYFRELAAEDLEALSFAMTPQRYAPGHVFIREGTTGDTLYLLLSGEVEVGRQVFGGEDVLNRLKPGELFGLIALIEDAPRSSSCRAVTDVEVAALPKSGFDLLFNAAAPVAYAFQCTLATQLARDFRKLDRQLRDAVIGAGLVKPPA